MNEKQEKERSKGGKIENESTDHIRYIQYKKMKKWEKFARKSAQHYYRRVSIQPKYQIMNIRNLLL